MYGWSSLGVLNRLVAQVEQEMKPLAESLNAMARDAARISALAAGQVERVDRLVTDLDGPNRADRHRPFRRLILRPLREGAAMMAGVRAVH